MIKLEHVVLPSLRQMDFVIEAMRNPMNSWDKSDSNYGGFWIERDACDPQSWLRIEEPTEEEMKNEYIEFMYDGTYDIGPNDLSLMQCLSNSGTDHRKFMRMMPIYVRITSPLYWWKEFDTYKVGTVANSCSTMHKIAEKEFTWDDFSHDHLDVRTRRILEETIKALNDYRKMYVNYNPDDFEINGCPSKKDIWWQMIQLLPSSYNQTRNVMLNYEVLANIYKARRNHKLDEWRKFCGWIERLPYSSLITGKETK